MRFFKAFSILHRRTKSDTFVSGSALESVTTNSEPPRRSSVPVSLFDLVTSQVPANFKHLSDRGSGTGSSVGLPVFGSEKELNTRLLEANGSWAKEYANLQCQFNNCREELYTERRRVQCLQHKLEEANRIILDLRMSLDHIATSGSSQDRLQSTISREAGILLDAPTIPNLVTDNTTSTTNIRTMDEYSSALRMTLATRKELRDQKKVALFWKRKVLDGNDFQSAITPSVSTISSVHDPLPEGRQIALNALISRRGLDSTLGGQMSWKDTPSGPPEIFIPKFSTCQLVDEVSGPSASSRLPAVSSENSCSSRLGPLASESIKAEIGSLFGSRGSSGRLASRKRREPSHSPSLIGRLTGFTYATTAQKKADLTDNVESFGDLHAIFAATFGVEKLLMDESNSTLNGIDMEDDSILRPLSVVSSGLPASSKFKFSNIPTRRRAVTSTRSHNEVIANTLKQASKDCTSRRSWKSYKARPATKGKTVLEGNMSPKRIPRLQKLRRGKENSFGMAIPIFNGKT